MTSLAQEHAGFLLHRRRYRETSALVDLMLRDGGRATLVAQGVFRPKSRLNGVLRPFLPLSVNWRGKGELRTLVAAEPIAAAHDLSGRSLYCGLYLNELLTRLTARGDPHPVLFHDYAKAIAALSAGEKQESALRLFEKRLLETIGYGLALAHDSETGAAILPGLQYTYVLEQGPVGISVERPPPGVPVLSGSTLLCLGAERPMNDGQLREAKALMRFVLTHLLAGKPLVSRTLFEKGP